MVKLSCLGRRRSEFFMLADFGVHHSSENAEHEFLKGVALFLGN